MLRSADGVFHSNRGEEQDEVDADTIYINIGEVTLEILECALQIGVDLVVEDALSSEGATTLRRLWKDYRSVFD